MKKVAILYDADYTLISEFHQNLLFKKRGINPDEFWAKVKARQREEEQKGDTNLDILYMGFFMNEIRNGGLKGLSIKELEETGNMLGGILYPGLPEFFQKVKEENPSVHISHNIVSMGIKPMLEGFFKSHVDRVFGYTFFDDFTQNNEINEVKGTVSSEEKAGQIIKISAGSGQDEAYPIKDMIYIGDGRTDINAFEFVKKNGGVSICVYDPNKQGSFDNALQFKKYVSYIVPADYGVGSKLWMIVNASIMRD